MMVLTSHIQQKLSHQRNMSGPMLFQLLIRSMDSADMQHLISIRIRILLTLSNHS